MNSLLKNLFHFEQEDSVGVQVFLRFFELFTVTYSIIYAWSWGRYILRISDVVLPLGLANYLPIELFFDSNLSLINASLITILATIAFLYRKFSWLYLIAFLLLHVQYVTRFSLGEIPHSSNLLGFSLLGLGLGFVFFKQKTKALSFAFGFLIFFLGLAYTSSAISKLIGTGVTWIDGNHLWLWISEKSVDVLAGYGTFNYSFIQELALSNRFIATVILSFGLLTELTAFLLWWKKLRPYIITLVIGMHLGIYYSMNIFFLSYMIELVIVGYPWYRLINKFESKIGEKEKKLILKLV